MELAEEAFLAERRGEFAKARELNQRAFYLEAEAAEALADSLDVEPTRSILYRSAATLAVRCGKLHAGERLASKGLAGRPSKEIAEELDMVLDEVKRIRSPRWHPLHLSDHRERIHYFNGVDEKTGKYLLPPLSTEELAELVRQAYAPQTFLGKVAEWLAKFAVDDPRRKPVVDTERPWDLSETGWGVIYGPNVDWATKLAIGELIEHRRSQVGPARPDYLRECTYRGEGTYDFLQRHGANPAMAADPDRFPFYLLLVGDPESLPYHFQYELDVQYAVGRLYFDQPQDYSHYVRSVIAAEGKPFVSQRRRTFFGVRNPGDETTWRTTDELVEPLSDSVVEPGAGWEAVKVVGDDARKERLLRLLGGDETPNVLFTASHGLGLDKDDGDRLFERQGALVCQDWPGPASGGVDPSPYVSAADIEDGAMVHGLIAFLFACHSAGSPERDDFTGGRPRRIAPRPFISRLPQRLLAHPHPRGGALAVIGHIDRAWTSSFEASPAGEARDVFRACLKRLLQGHTVGYAMQHFNRMYSTLASQLDHLWQAKSRKELANPDLLIRLWGTSNDARNFILLGDPAVRIPGMKEAAPVR
jgi:hypothetical protein